MKAGKKERKMGKPRKTGETLKRKEAKTKGN